MSYLVENLMIGKYAATHRYFVIQFDFKSKELRNPDKKSSYIYLKVRSDRECKHARKKQKQKNPLDLVQHKGSPDNLIYAQLFSVSCAADTV